MNVTERALHHILPSREEEKNVLKASRELISKIEGECERLKIRAEPILVGSVSKGTFIDPDIDIFIAFDRSYSLKEIINFGLLVGHNVLRDGNERYAEHPYVSGHHLGFKVDVVPCYRMSKGEKIITAVDRSPLHTQYVNEHLSIDGRNQVRLLKAFLKSSGLYGSQVSVKGFSGYVCELLVVHFGSFHGVIDFFSTSKGKISIDIEGHGKKDFKDPLVIVDPVDQRRNAGAAVSIENLSKLRVLSREFLIRPDISYFVWGRRRKIQKMQRGTNFTLFSLPKPDITDDIIYPQAEKFASALLRIIEMGGFQPINFEIDLGKNIEILIEHLFSASRKFSVKDGPPADSERTHDFIEKYRKVKGHIGPYIKGDRLYFDIPEKSLGIEDYVMMHLKDYNIGKTLEKIKDKTLIEEITASGERRSIMRKFYSRNILPEDDWDFYPPEKTS
ncbi:MAG: CCA tRNA nucleotidyltransferase [Candidatus Thermoplasmatota archaeon]|nr:CCA tRNA nucleotidyltransferase [Candidatus Thermoplasmatota archaeon]MCL5665446.1 CCA tRNA nucleotidyltransferase [Candidatus Thermoplasmatota archaeon]